ncbi:MAG: M24 family metallopeptidase [Thermoleophilia bacterium]
MPVHTVGGSVYDPQVYGRRVGYHPSEAVFNGIDRSAYLLDRPSDAEYERRHACVRRFMQERGLDCLIVQSGAGASACQNVRWLTNQLPQFGNAYLVVSANGEMTLFVGFQFLVDPARRAQVIIEDVRGGAPRDFGRMAASRVKELGHKEGRIGIVEVDAGSIPPQDLEVFAHDLKGASVEFVTDDWWSEVRLIKGPEEIDFMERAAAIGDKVIEAIVDNIRPGMTEAELFGCAYAALFKNGGELGSPLLMLGSSDTFASGSALHRERPQNRVLQRGDIVCEELDTWYCDGSVASTSKPVALGEPSDSYLEMVELMLKVYEAEIDHLRPGRTSEDLRRAAAPILEAGYAGTCPVLFGIPGRGAGEFPCAVAFDDPASHRPAPFVLRPGMTVVLHPYPCSVDYRKGVEISDTWLITEDEPRCLHRYPRRLTIV